MPEQIIAVIVGAVIGSTRSLLTTLVISSLKERRRKKSIKAIVAAEITAVLKKTQRFIEGDSDSEELKASTPLLMSIASEIGYLAPKELIAYRHVVTMDMEMRQSCKKEKAELVILACEEAMRLINVQ